MELKPVQADWQQIEVEATRKATRRWGALIGALFGLALVWTGIGSYVWWKHSLAGEHEYFMADHFVYMQPELRPFVAERLKDGRFTKGEFAEVEREYNRVRITKFHCGLQDANRPRGR